MEPLSRETQTQTVALPPTLELGKRLEMLIYASLVCYSCSAHTLGLPRAFGVLERLLFLTAAFITHSLLFIGNCLIFFQRLFKKGCHSFIVVFLFFRKHLFFLHSASAQPTPTEEVGGLNGIICPPLIGGGGARVRCFELLSSCGRERRVVLGLGAKDG